MKKNATLLWLCALLLLMSGCAGTRLRRTSVSPEDFVIQQKMDKKIKVHLKDGGLYSLNSWKINPSSDTITGIGNHYDYKRNLIKEKKQFTIPAQDITLIETNSITRNLGNLTAFSIVGVPMFALSTYCLANPKACFGSCPTFYASHQGEPMLMAEGFSSSIAPYLEKKDIDMLFWADDSRGEISLKLTNEALETHVIRYADLLLFSRSGQERVFATEDGRFFRTSKVIRPLSCRAEEGSCLEQVKAMDKIERYCGTDPDNLAKKEEIIITFRNDHSSRMGFLIGSRQTLLTTFLFYQLMGFSGSLYGEMSAKVENGHGNARDKVQRLWDKLGGIEVFIQKPNSGWTKIDEIKEMGPIAPDVHLVDLPRSDQEEITLKLQLTKGLWRIDWLAVAEILGVETPLRIKPEMVLRNDTIDLDAKLRLTEQKNPLITFPGDQFELKYKIPDDCDYQYFLETKGYYLEWMREEWLKDQNMKKVALAIHFPGLFMRKVAPEFKKAEPRMEKIFWESRYVKQ